MRLCRLHLLLHQRPAAFNGRSFARNATSQAASATNAEQQLLRQQLAQLKELEKDLGILESGLGHFRKEKDLWPLKDKWKLSAKINGGNVTSSDAREAVCSELRKLADGLRNSTSRFAVPVPSIEVPNVGAIGAGDAARVGGTATAMIGDGGRGGGGGKSSLPLLGGGVAAVTLAGLAAYQLWPVGAGATASPSSSSSAPSTEGTSSSSTAIPSKVIGSAASEVRGESAPASSSSKSSSAAPAAAAAAAKVSQPPKAAEAPPAAAASPAASASAPAGQVSAPGKEGDEGFWTPSMTRAAVGLAVAAGLAGAWWLWFGRRPPIPPGGISTGVTVAAAAATAEEARKHPTSPTSEPAFGGLSLGAAEDSVKARQAAEVIFENAPKEQQTWDMAASVRGLPGAVSQRVGKIEK